MSRIRSVHPGFFTDEDLVSVSMAARLLFIGLGIEADDKGIFEWKPLTIKMRIFPADAVDIPELLSELEAVGAIRRFDKFGAIRNFCKFQRPKKPNNIHLASAEMLAFTTHGSVPKADNGKDIPHQFPTSGENSQQMEDGEEGRMEDEGSEADASSPGERASEEPSGGETTKPEKSRKPKATAKTSFERPDWIPAVEWDGYIEMRNRKGKPPTDRALELVVIELEGLRRNGHDPGQVLDQSTRRNWTDVYPLKDQNDGNQQTNRGPASGYRQPDRRDSFTREIDRAAGLDGPIEPSGPIGRFDFDDPPGDSLLPAARPAALR